MDKINVKEYLENKNALELNYLSYVDKLELADLIMENVIEDKYKPPIINTAILKNIAVQSFINQATNLDLSVEANDGQDGYDILSYSNELTNLLASIDREFSVFESILNDRVNDFYRYEYSTSKAIYDLARSVKDLVNMGAKYVDDALKDVDLDQIVEKYKDVIPPLKDNQPEKKGDDQNENG